MLRLGSNWEETGQLNASFILAIGFGNANIVTPYLWLEEISAIINVYKQYRYFIKTLHVAWSTKKGRKTILERRENKTNQPLSLYHRML